MFKALCIGADVCNSARGMMLALGCVQSLKCNTNECSTSVTTNNPKLVRSLEVTEKWKRVSNYHQHMLDDFSALLAASGCHSLDEMNRNLIYRKVDKQWHSYAEVVKTQRIL
ncbi:glutamate synthase-related protein [Shewanella sp. PP-He15 brown]